MAEWAEGLRLHLSPRSATGYLCVLKKGKFYRVNSRLGTRKPSATEIAGVMIIIEYAKNGKFFRVDLRLGTRKPSATEIAGILRKVE